METQNGNNSMVMPVSPMYGNGGGFGNGFGGDGWWIILLFVLLGGGNWGMGGFGGFGNMALGYDFPWLLNGQQGINANTNAGFNQAATNAALGDISNAVTSGFGNVQTSLCSGFAGVNATVNGAQNAITQQLYTNQLADLERSFNAQTASTAGMSAIQAQLAQCCCDNRAATADLKYTVATENCADRTQAMQNTRDIIDAQTRNTQAILDKLCQLELDGVKGQLASAQRENVALQNQVNMAAFRESQANQNALFAQGMTNEVDALYNRLKNCPVNTVPVYGNQPVFTCAGPNLGNMGCGCGAVA